MNGSVIARTLATLGVVCLLSACPKATRPPLEEKPAPVPPAPAAEVAGATIYTVNPDASEVHILVYRGGALARLGHNHVVSARDLQGRLWVHPTLQRSGFELSLPVARLVVDDAAARRAAGGDFSSDVPAGDKEGTRSNMLRAEVLDAERFPEILLRSVRIAGTLQQPQVTARITIKDVSRDVQIPVTMSVAAGRASCAGELEIRQTDFGIKPFSAALGALEVQDVLRVRFSIVAEQQPL